MPVSDPVQVVNEMLKERCAASMQISDTEQISDLVSDRMHLVQVHDATNPVTFSGGSGSQFQLDHTQASDNDTQLSDVDLHKADIAIDNPDRLNLMQSCQAKKELKKSDTQMQKKKTVPPPEGQRRILTRSKAPLNN